MKIARDLEREMTDVPTPAGASLAPESIAAAIALATATPIEGARSHEQPLAVRLRQRYSPSVIPRCRLCAGELSLERVGGGAPDLWACSPFEPDSVLTAQLRTKPGRGVADPHYSESRYEDPRGGGDVDVIALLDAARVLALAAQRQSDLQQI